jgi:hypothetical protein
MTKVALFLGVVLAVACSSNSGDIAKLREAKDRVCACTTATCRLEASKDLKDLSKKLMENAKDMSADERADIAKISREMVDCVQNGR